MDEMTVLGVMGAACAVGGLVVWVAPSRPGRAGAVLAAGVALAAFWRAAGIEDAEGRLVDRGTELFFRVGADSDGGIAGAVLVVAAGLFGLTACLAAGVLWLRRALQLRAAGDGRGAALHAASAAGAAAWFFTGLYLVGLAPGFWATDLAERTGLLAWRLWIESAVTALDMTGFVAAWAVSGRAQSSESSSGA